MDENTVDPTLAAVHGWADKQVADLTAAAQPDPFAPVGQDIHEDMARIYEIAGEGNYEHSDDPDLAYRLDRIADIARGWIED